MNSVVVLDACTIVNLARIDEGDFLEDRIKALMNVYAVEKVITEVKDRYVPSDKTSKRQLHIAPYWGGLMKRSNDDVKDETFFIKSFLNYQKNNGELYSAALSLYLSRIKSEKVLFYTDDFPAKSKFEPCFEFQQMGFIGDSVDLLVFLYWLSPQGQFSKDELKKYLTALCGEYPSKIKELRKKIDQYVSTLSSSSKKEAMRRFEMEGFSDDLANGRQLNDTISRCKRFFDGDKTPLGKEINRMIDGFKTGPMIVEKIVATIQRIDEYGIYKRKTIQ